jgi:hypothetical protein
MAEVKEPNATSSIQMNGSERRLPSGPCRFGWLPWDSVLRGVEIGLGTESVRIAFQGQPAGEMYGRPGPFTEGCPCRA